MIQRSENDIAPQLYSILITDTACHASLMHSTQKVVGV